MARFASIRDVCSNDRPMGKQISLCAAAGAENDSARCALIVRNVLSEMKVTEIQWKTIEAYNKSAYQFDNTIGKLTNYNTSYDYLADLLEDGDSILDLACGSGQISKYLSERKHVLITGVDLSQEMLKIAQQKIPTGTFYKESIIHFPSNTQFHAVIIGFGLPYLNRKQVRECLRNSVKYILNEKYIYISFMEGVDCRIEKTSFGGDYDFLIYYHQREYIVQLLKELNVHIIKEYELDYKEEDGSISKDIVFIGKKREISG